MTVDPKTLDDPSKIRTLMDNARRVGREDIEFACIEWLADLQAAGASDPVDVACWRAVYAAEEIATRKNGKTTRLQRTRNKINDVGIRQTVGDIAGNPVVKDGFEILKSGNLLHLTFEYIVLQHSEHFTAVARANAERKLLEAGFDPKKLPDNPDRTGL